MEAAAEINALSQDIGDWAKKKGFRKDWEDADWLEQFVGRNGASINHDDQSKIFEIAKEHRRMANVTKLMLMVSELSEALEGMRDGGNYGEELGDLVIRALENADANDIDIGDEIVAKVAKNQDRPYMHGRKF